MHAAAKMVIGLILILIGLGLFVDSVYPLFGGAPLIPVDWLANFIIVLTGVIPICLILLGLFIVWLEADELKSSKEFEEPEKEKPKRKKK
jgi:protein-S-isoprenylcysteine O-methyltransferase Ste14